MDRRTQTKRTRLYLYDACSVAGRSLRDRHLEWNFPMTSGASRAENQEGR
jgi:hypothetical protein